MKNWKKIIEEECKDEDDLVKVIIKSPEEYKEKAWLFLLRSSPESWHFFEIIIKGPDHYKEKAWKKFLDASVYCMDFIKIIEHKKTLKKYRVAALRKIIARVDFDSFDVLEIRKKRNKGIWEDLLRQKLTNDDLCNVIKYGPLEFQNKAWNQLLKQNLKSIEVYRKIICASFGDDFRLDFPDIYKRKSWEELLKQNPTIDDLDLILNDAQERYYKDKAWEELMKRMSTSHDFICKINKINIPEEYRTEKHCHLSGKKFSNYELLLIIEECPKEYKVKAWEQLLKQNPDENDLSLIVAFAPEKYSKKAEEVLSERRAKPYG